MKRQRASWKGGTGKGLTPFTLRESVSSVAGKEPEVDCAKA